MGRAPTLSAEKIAQQRLGDFDFSLHLPQTILYVTDIPICSRIEEPETPTIVDTQVSQDLVKHIEVRRPKTDAFAQYCKVNHLRRQHMEAIISTI